MRQRHNAHFENFDLSSLRVIWVRYALRENSLVVKVVSGIRRLRIIVSWVDSASPTRRSCVRLCDGVA
jgi:hypothetical protein